MKLFPRIPSKVARALASEHAERPCRKLEACSRLSHPAAIYTPTGGAKATEGDLDTLRSGLRRVAAAFGYIYGEEEEPPRLSDKAAFDLALAKHLDGALPITPNEASRRGVWAFLGCCLAPELVRWRFPGQGSEPRSSAERFEGGRQRNLFARVWWRARLLKDESSNDPYWALDYLGEDQQVQLLERSKLSGWKPLNLALVRLIREVEELDLGVATEGLFRDVMKRFKRRSGILCFDALEDDKLMDSLRDLFRESLFSEGVEFPTQGSAPTWDPDADWQSVAPDRRARFMQALTPDQLRSLGDLLDRHLWEWGEVEPVWRAHFQLSCPVGAVLDRVEPMGEDLPHGRDSLGAWLTEVSAGSWCTEVDRPRGQRFLQSLRDKEASAIFALAGWEWSEHNLSAALRRIRREFSGDWQELLTSFDDDSIRRLRDWFPIGGSASTEELRTSLAQWLLDDEALDWPVATELMPAPALAADTAPPDFGPTPSTSLEQPLPADVPGLIAATLARAQVRTVSDLLELDPLELSRFNGVGTKKIEAVENYQAVLRASMSGGPARDASPAPKARSLEEMNLPAHVLRVLATAGITSTPQLAEQDLLDLMVDRGVSLASAKAIATARDRLASLAVEPPDAPRLPMAYLAEPLPTAPGLVSGILDRNDVHTIGDLLDMDVLAIAETPGVGITKLTKLRDFRNHVLRAITEELEQERGS